MAAEDEHSTRRTVGAGTSTGPGAPGGSGRRPTPGQRRRAHPGVVRLQGVPDRNRPNRNQPQRPGPAPGALPGPGRTGPIPAPTGAGRADPRLVGRLRRLTVRRVLRTAATGGRFTGAVVLLHRRAARAADDTGICPPSHLVHMAGALHPGGGPAGSNLHPTPGDHPTSRPAPTTEPERRHRRGRPPPIRSAAHLTRPRHRLPVNWTA